jgi:hypothetical protein
MAHPSLIFNLFGLSRLERRADTILFAWALVKKPRFLVFREYGAEFLRHVGSHIRWFIHAAFVSSKWVFRVGDRYPGLVYWYLTTGD